MMINYKLTRIVLVTGTLSLSNIGFTTSVCLELLLRTNGELDPNIFRSKPEIRPEFVKNHRTDDYVHGDRAFAPARDQCDLGSCWANSTLGLFERLAQRKTGQFIRLSDDYLIYRQILDKAWQYFVKKGKLNQIVAGGSIKEAFELSHWYGIVPESAWQPRLSLKDRDVNEDWFVKSFQVVANELNGEKLTADEKYSRFLSKLEQVVGPIPSTKNIFKVGQHDMSPRDFYQQNVTKKESLVGWRKVRNETDSIDLFLKLKKEIDSGGAVLLAVDWETLFIDSKTGISSIEAFAGKTNNLPSGQELTEKANHGLLVLDYAVDKDGTPTKLLVQNSHGSESGHNGYFHIYWDFVRAFWHYAEGYDFD